MVYATYVGGSGTEGYQYRNGLSVDSNGNVYITGRTNSTDFPTTNQSSVNATLSGSSDGVITRFSNPDGQGHQLDFATYFGGDGNDRVTDLAIDDSGTIHFAGTTTSTDLPTTPGAFRGDNLDASQRTFLARMDTSLQVSQLTYFGEMYSTEPVVLAVDSTGSTFLAGHTYSDSFPVTSGAFQTQRGGVDYDREAFLAKFDPTGGLEFSTFYVGVEREVSFFLRFPARNAVRPRAR